MDQSEFRKALYYAVREDFNADISKGHIERNPKLNELIVDAIRFYESYRGKRFPYQMSMIEIIGLARASKRRRRGSPLRGSR